jgi:hypothetical protein
MWFFCGSILGLIWVLFGFYFYQYEAITKSSKEEQRTDRNRDFMRVYQHFSITNRDKENRFGEALITRRL